MPPTALRPWERPGAIGRAPQPRPGRRRARAHPSADLRRERDEGRGHRPAAVVHSITSSARISSDFGIVQPERARGLQVDRQLEHRGLLDQADLQGWRRAGLLGIAARPVGVLLGWEVGFEDLVDKARRALPVPRVGRLESTSAHPRRRTRAGRTLQGRSRAGSARPCARDGGRTSDRRARPARRSSRVRWHRLDLRAPKLRSLELQHRALRHATSSTRRNRSRHWPGSSGRRPASAAAPRPPAAQAACPGLPRPRPTCRSGPSRSR